MRLVLSRRKLETATDTSAKTEPQYASQKGHELHSSMERVAERCGAHSITQNHLQDPPKAGILPSDEGTKTPVKKGHLISTHKHIHVQSRKERPSLCFSPFAYFPISHHTNQTAKLPPPPNKAAILRADRHAPWQPPAREAGRTIVPLLHADPPTAVPSLVRSSSCTTRQAPWTRDGTPIYTKLKA